MYQDFFRRQLPTMAVISVLTISLVGWQEKQNAGDVPYSVKDTVPSAKEKKLKNIEEALHELEKAQLELEKTMQKMEKEMKIPEPPQPPLPDIDMEKMKADIEKSLKEIDKEKIQAEIELALKAVNQEDLRRTVEEALKEVDAEKLRAEVKASLAKVNMEQVKAEVKRVHEEELPKMRAELKSLKPQIETSLSEAKKGIEKARKELQEYKAFEDGLAKDGLINKSRGYKIEHRKGQLIINGITQPSSTYEKYRSFLEKHPNFIIENNNERFNVNIE